MRAGRPTKATADMTKGEGVSAARRGVKQMPLSGLRLIGLKILFTKDLTLVKRTTDDVAPQSSPRVTMPAMACHLSLSARVSVASTPRVNTTKSASARRVATVTRASASGSDSAQLGTAILPKEINESVFVNSLWQWANGLTTSGQNLPFALPQRVDPLEFGFSMAFLQSDPKGEPGTFVSVGEIVATVEDVDAGRALIVRGTGKAAEKGVLVDVPMVMNTMVPAIKNAIAMGSQ